MIEMTQNKEEKESLILAIAIKIMLMMISGSIPACQETIIALKLLARMNEIMPNDIELLMRDDKGFLEIYNRELQFLMKDN